jgi:hypothetical protein
VTAYKSLLDAYYTYDLVYATTQKKKEKEIRKRK